MVFEQENQFPGYCNAIYKENFLYEFMQKWKVNVLTSKIREKLRLLSMYEVAY